MSRLTAVIPSGTRRRIQLALHRGTAVTCPLCGFSGRDLRPLGHDLPVLSERQVIGGGLRPSQCHACRSTDRERLVVLYLREVFDLPARAATTRVLHIAPEKRLSKHLLTLGLAEYLCGDLFTEGYAHPEHVRNMDVTDLPLADGAVDLIICNHVLEHVPDDARAMRELRRVLAPGGRAVLQVPISANSAATFEDDSVVDPADRERVFGQFDHVRIYGQDYPDRLRAAGFAVERLPVAERWLRYGVNPAEELFICSA